MILSGANIDWSIGFTSAMRVNMYLGCTSLSDIHKATHKVVAYIVAPSTTSALFGVAFEEAVALPAPPTTLTSISQTLGNGQYYDSDQGPLLFDGAIIGTTSTAYPASTVFELAYASLHTFTGMSPFTATGCSYMYNQSVQMDVYNGTTLVGSVTNSRSYSASPQTVWSTGWSGTISAVGNKVRITATATYNTAYTVTKTTLGGLLPIHGDKYKGAVPTFGVLLDPLTGSATYISNLIVIDTSIQSVDVY